LEALKERKYYEGTDKWFSGSSFFRRFKIPDWVLIKFFDLGCLTTRKVFSNKNKCAKTIAIISLHRLGDTVFTIPAIREIFNHYADYKTFIFCFTESKSIYEIEFKDHLIKTISKNEFKVGRRIASSKSRQIINEIEPEIIFDITGTFASASLLFNSAAIKTIGINIRYFKNLYTNYIPIRVVPHFMDIYMDVIRQVIAIDSIEERYKFNTTTNGNSKLLIHPFAIRKSKEWNLNRFIGIATILKKNYDVEFISPPGFLEDFEIEEIQDLKIPLTITETVKDMIQKIKECSLFISNDTGPVYIASLLGKPTFTIYGPTNPKYSLPFGKNHNFIWKKLICSAENDKHCITRGGINCPAFECMNLLTEKDVLGSLDSFLEELEIDKLLE
jgi:lipopolysaccharide heptosyltransferase II